MAAENSQTQKTCALCGSEFAKFSVAVMMYKHGKRERKLSRAVALCPRCVTHSALEQNLFADLLRDNYNHITGGNLL